MATEVLQDGVVRETEERAVPLTPEEIAQRAEFDRLLAGVEESRKAQAYTLAELLGQPVAYEPIPALYFVRPKLGHKMDLQRRCAAIQAQFDEDKDEEKAMNAHLTNILPYTFIKGADGTVQPATVEELMFRVFDDVEEFFEFFAHLNTSKRAAAAEGTEGN